MRFNSFLKNLGIGLCTIAILLLFPFFWQEKLSFLSTINFQKIGSYFGIISAIATSMALYFLYAQLEEMKSARISEGQPDIHPVQVYLKIETRKLDNEDINSLDILVPQLLIDNSLTPKEGLFLELYNIGRGSAKNILVEWIYNEQEITDFTKDVYQFMDLPTNKIQRYGFIKPDSTLLVLLPISYLRCCAMKFNFDYANFPVIKEKPSLSLKLQWQDINNLSGSNTFKVDVFIPGAAIIMYLRFFLQRI